VVVVLRQGPWRPSFDVALTGSQCRRPAPEQYASHKLRMHQVHEITGIPCPALQGAPLSEFSINKRLRWMEHRRTKYPEDKAYSLLGVVDVDLAPCYGEGADGAFRRLHDEIDKTRRCIQGLCGTDPCDDKKRIEDMKQRVSEARVTRFLHRNHDKLTSKWSSGMDALRHKASSEVKYKLYFDLLHSKIKEYKILASIPTIWTRKAS
jgi:hypothetical protein